MKYAASPFTRRLKDHQTALRPSCCVLFMSFSTRTWGVGGGLGIREYVAGDSASHEICHKSIRALLKRPCSCPNKPWYCVFFSSVSKDLRNSGRSWNMRAVVHVVVYYVKYFRSPFMPYSKPRHCSISLPLFPLSVVYSKKRRPTSEWDWVRLSRKPWNIPQHHSCPIKTPKLSSALGVVLFFHLALIK